MCQYDTKRQIKFENEKQTKIKIMLNLYRHTLIILEYIKWKENVQNENGYSLLYISLFNYNI